MGREFHSQAVLKAYDAAGAFVCEDILPLAQFDQKAKRFWGRVFRLMRIPGGRYLLRFLARSDIGGRRTAICITASAAYCQFIEDSRPTRKLAVDPRVELRRCSRMKCRVSSTLAREFKSKILPGWPQ